MHGNASGHGYYVEYNDLDSRRFAARWPGSTVQGSGSFVYDANGDLVDVLGSAETGDGADWAAFSLDCQARGGPAGIGYGHAVERGWTEEH